MTITPTGASLGRTLGDWCDALLEEYLDVDGRGELSLVSGTLAAASTVLTLAHAATGLRSGALVEIEDELLHVWSASSTTTATVQRAMRDTTAVEHADGTLVRLNPRWPRVTLANQLRREVRSWPVNLYAVAVGELAIAASTEAFDLDGLSGYDVVRICRVQQDHPSDADASWPEVSWRFERNQNVTDFPSGYALRLPAVPGTARTLRVTVGYAFPVPATLDFTADLGTTWHLNHRLADAAMLGVAARLLGTGEIHRTDDRSQQRPRRAEEVPPGHRLQAGESLMRERDRLLMLEAERLANAYPWRF